MQVHAPQNSVQHALGSFAASHLPPLLKSHQPQHTRFSGVAASTEPANAILWNFEASLRIWQCPRTGSATAVSSPGQEIQPETPVPHSKKSACETMLVQVAVAFPTFAAADSCRNAHCQCFSAFQKLLHVSYCFFHARVSRPSQMPGRRGSELLNANPMLNPGS